MLGRGGYGEVHLQSQDSDRQNTRALKIINERPEIDLGGLPKRTEGDD